MPHFHNPTGGYCLSNSLKVMYSLLSSQAGLQPLSSQKFSLGHYLRLRSRQPKMPHYLLVRHPYRRVVSAYKNKLLGLAHHAPEPWKEMEKVRQHIVLLLGLSPDTAPEAMHEALLAVSFGRFVAMLPSLSLLDPHFSPQKNSAWVFARNRPLFLYPITRLLHMESPRDLAFMQDKLGIDVSNKENSSDHHQLSDPWSFTLKGVVRRVYREDFEYFSFPT